MSATQSRAVSKAPEMAEATVSKAAAVQGQVDEVIGIMQTNIEKVMVRGENLNSLNSKTEQLSTGAIQFKKTANKIESAMWWKNVKLLLIIGGLGTAVLLLVLSTAGVFKSK